MHAGNADACTRLRQDTSLGLEPGFGAAAPALPRAGEVSLKNIIPVVDTGQICGRSRTQPERGQQPRSTQRRPTARKHQNLTYRSAECSLQVVVPTVVFEQIVTTRSVARRGMLEDIP